MDVDKSEERKYINLRIWLADLTYTQQTVASDVMPQAVGGIATYVQKHLTFPEPIRVFKYPEKLAESIQEMGCPEIIGFSNYIWNHDLSYEFIKVIKKISPQTIIVFGGPNYPVALDEQIAFLREHPLVDFYISKEGERAFCKLIEAIAETNFDAESVKVRKLPSIHAIGRNNTVYISETLDRFRDLTEIPSPYLTGLMDEFFDGILMPVIQTNRGCPFSCTFCVEGVKYYNKIHRNSAEKISGEIDYIGRKMAGLRSRGGRNDLFIADSNFGMYMEDIETCRQLAHARKKYQWPEYINVATGKNQKERVLEASRLVEGAMRLSGSVQSLDREVLKNVKRDNISEGALMDLALSANETGANSYCEIILGLPGDSLTAHYKTVQAVMDAGFINIYLFQLMLLPGTELAMKETKQTFQMDCRYRVLPRCYGHYKIGDESLVAAEIEEICVANSTLSFDDYLECRRLHLVITIFYNDSVFSALLKFLRCLGLSPWRWMELLRDIEPPGGLKAVFDSFMDATRNELWKSREDLYAFVRQPGVVEKFIDGQLGSNLLFVHKTRAITETVSELTEHAELTIKQILKESGKDTPENLQFVEDAITYHKLRISNLFHDRDSELYSEFHYDIRTFLEDNIPLSISAYMRTPPISYRFVLEESQRQMINRYLNIYGDTTVGIGRILSKVHNKKLLRKVVKKGETLSGESELRYLIAGLQN